MSIKIDKAQLIVTVRNKIALIESLIEQDRKDWAQYEKDRVETAKLVTTAKEKYAASIAKSLVKQATNYSLSRGYNGEATVSLTFDSSVSLPEEPDYNVLYPYPTQPVNKFPVAFRKNGEPISVREQLAGLKNTLEWLQVIDPDSALTQSEFGRITTHL